MLGPSRDVAGAETTGGGGTADGVVHGAVRAGLYVERTVSQSGAPQTARCRRRVRSLGLPVPVRTNAPITRDFTTLEERERDGP